MVVLSDLVTELTREGARAASLKSLSAAPTSKSLVGILAERTGLQIVNSQFKTGFDLFQLADVAGRLKSPFAVVCIDGSQVTTPQQLGVDVDHELRMLNFYDRPTLVLFSEPFTPIRPHLEFSDQHFVMLSCAELVQILLAHPPRDALTKRMIESTPLRLLNPYIYRGPIDDRLFVGREDDLKLLTKMDASYALVGPRSIGKTSLINQAINRLKADGCVVLRAEFSSVMGEFELLTKFIRQFVDSYGAWKEFLARVSASSFDRLVEYFGAKRRVIVFIDEADDLTKRCPSLTTSLRRQHDEGRLRFVLVGYKQLRRSLSDAAGSLFNVIQRLDISSISHRECGALVLRPMAELGITFDDLEAVVNVLYSASGGTPSRIQLMCHALVDDLDARSRRDISVADAERAIRLRQVRDEIENWYRASTTEKERAIAGCVSILATKGVPSSRSEIVRQIISEFPISADRVNWEIEDLITADVFREYADGTLGFTFPELEYMVRPTGDKRMAIAEFRRFFRELQTQGAGHGFQPY